MENYQYYLYGLATGISISIAIATMIALYIASRRHSCYCGCRTRKRCWLYHLPGQVSNDPAGRQKYVAYIFRICNREHISFQMKVITLTQEQVLEKPNGEFDLSDRCFGEYCIRAGVVKPTLLDQGSIIAQTGLFPTSRN